MLKTLVSHIDVGSVAPASALAPSAAAHATAARNPFTSGATVVNQWIGGGMCGDNGLVEFGSTTGLATKRPHPGSLVGVT